MTSRKYGKRPIMTTENQKNDQPLLLLPAPLKNGEKTAIKPEKDPESGQFVSGNQGGPGRPVGLKNFTTRVKAGLSKLAAKDQQGNPVEVEEALAEKVIKMALAGDRKMIELIWNYLDGKPQNNGGNNFNGNNFVTFVMSAADEKRIEDLFEPKEWSEVEIIKNSENQNGQSTPDKKNGPDNSGRPALPQVSKQGSAYEGNS